MNGTVVDMKETTSRDEDTITTTYQPIFEFTGPNGELLRGDTLLAAANYNFERGSQHTILVNFKRAWHSSHARHLALYHRNGDGGGWRNYGLFRQRRLVRIGINRQQKIP